MKVIRRICETNTEHATDGLTRIDLTAVSKSGAMEDYQVELWINEGGQLNVRVGWAGADKNIYKVANPVFVNETTLQCEVPVQKQEQICGGFAKTYTQYPVVSL